jgi:Holliday junction resolvasome RuvABC endonuclease subunit
MTLVVGLDPSYSCTALVAVDARTGFPQRRLRLPTEKKKFCSDAARLVAVRDAVLAFLRDCGEVALVAIEGYSFGSRNNREKLGELGGVLRVAVWEAGVPYAVVPIPTLKSFVCGKGNVEKSMMLREVFRKWQYEAEDDNDADAFGLAQVVRLVWMKDLNLDLTKRELELCKKIEVVRP